MFKRWDKYDFAFVIDAAASSFLTIAGGVMLLAFGFAAIYWSVHHV